MLLRRQPLLLLCSAALFAVGCPEDNPPPNPSASIVVQLPQGGAVPSDGSSTRRVLLIATNADREPDTSTITVAIESGGGAMALADTTDFVAEELTGTPNENGAFAFDYRCPLRSDEGVTMRATNTSGASARVVLSCQEPGGPIVVTVDQGDCSGLSADGQSRCDVNVTVNQVGTVNLPLSGLLSVTVTDVSNVQIADDAQPGINPDGETAVLALAGGPPAPALSVEIADGIGTFEVASPAFGLSQAVALRLAFQDSTQTAVVTIAPFNNQASVAIAADAASLVSETSTTLTVTARATDGLPPGGTDPRVVLLTVAGADDAATRLTGADANGVLAITLDDAGEGTATFTAPAVAGDPVVYTVSAAYAFLGAQSITATQTITVNEAGALIVNGNATPSALQSDVVGQDRSVVTVNVQQNGADLQGASVSFSLDAAALGRVRINEDGDSNGQHVVTTNVDGDAVINVTVLNARVRGNATIDFVATVAGEDPVAGSVTLTIDRAPILQSIIFVSATPDTIGVRGSSIATSSSVSFQLLDDTNAPMPNIPVTFQTNATADPTATVEPDDISDSQGLVSTVLSAGTQAGPITIVVRGQQGANALTVESAPIAVVGGLPNMLNSYLECPLTDSAQQAPFTANCTAVLVDRFTNTAQDGLLVQFRAEAGNITPAVASASGSATATFATGNPGRASADMTGWSYGAIVPLVASDIAGFMAPGAAADCFDGDSTSPCDVVELCASANANADLFCPLIPDCATEAAALVQGIQGVDALDYFTNATARAAVDAYVNGLLVCGHPLSCLTGSDLSFIQGDECPVAPGCMDFDGGTACPQEGLITLLASARGEEPFIDTNGNGIFDFVDVNGNGRHDVNEPFGPDTFIDQPEPFLDKNDNCFRDDHINNPRLAGTASAIVETDLFSDTDASGTFGFGAQSVETNGVWDRDIEVLLSTHVLAVAGDGVIEVGRRCTTPGVTVACPFGGAPVRCTETSPGEGIQVGCVPGRLADGASADIAFRVVDGLGNCPSIGFASNVDASAEGGLVFSGAATTALDDARCGFTPSAINTVRPWCRSQPALGTPLLSATVTAACDGADEDITSAFRVSFEDLETTVAVTVDCTP